MNKMEFVLELTQRLSFLPWEEVEEWVGYYAEMIDDRMEEGLSEEEAVAAMGSTQEVVAQITADIPLATLVKERVKPKRRLKAGEIILLILGSPIWLSLGIAAFAVVLSLYISLWSVVISLWSVFVSLAACTLGGILGGAVLAVCGNGAAGMVMLAVGILCAGISIFMFYGCKAATKGMGLLSKKMVLGMKRCFVKKEVA